MKDDADVEPGSDVMREDKGIIIGEKEAAEAGAIVVSEDFAVASDELVFDFVF
jgi:hypothetical protein